MVWLSAGREAVPFLGWPGIPLGDGRVRAAVAAGLAVKVNTVLIPGVNDAHVARLACILADLGAHRMNLMPLIPGGHMADLRAPTCDELRTARDAAEAYLPQFRKCEHCSADVVRMV